MRSTFQENCNIPADNKVSDYNNYRLMKEVEREYGFVCKFPEIGIEVEILFCESNSSNTAGPGQKKCSYIPYYLTWFALIQTILAP